MTVYNYEKAKSLNVSKYRVDLKTHRTFTDVVPKTLGITVNWGVY